MESNFDDGSIVKLKDKINNLKVRRDSLQLELIEEKGRITKAEIDIANLHVIYDKSNLKLQQYEKRSNELLAIINETENIMNQIKHNAINLKAGLENEVKKLEQELSK